MGRRQLECPFDDPFQNVRTQIQRQILFLTPNRCPVAVPECLHTRSTSAIVSAQIAARAALEHRRQAAHIVSAVCVHHAASNAGGTLPTQVDIESPVHAPDLRCHPIGISHIGTIHQTRRPPACAHLSRHAIPPPAVNCMAQQRVILPGRYTHTAAGDPIRRLRNDIDHAADGIGAIKRRCRPQHHLNPVDLRQPHRQVFPAHPLEIAAQHRFPVQQHQHAVVDRFVQPPDAHLALKRLNDHHIHTRNRAQGVPKGLSAQGGQILRRNHMHRRRRQHLRLRLPRGRHHPGLLGKEIEDVFIRNRRANRCHHKRKTSPYKNDTSHCRMPFALAVQPPLKSIRHHPFPTPDARMAHTRQIAQSLQTALISLPWLIRGTSVSGLSTTKID